MAKERTKATFELVEKPAFPKTHDGAMLTSNDLSKHINALMSRIFADYAGSRVFVDQSGSQGLDGSQISLNMRHPVQVELFFGIGNYVESDKKIYAFRPITDSIKAAAGTNAANSYLARAIGHNVAISQNRSSEITEEGIDILSEMLWYEIYSQLPNNPNPKDFSKRGIVVEASTAQPASPYMSQANKPIIYNVVRFMDINSILSKLFDDEDRKMWYQVAPIKPISTIGPNGYVVPNTVDQKWLFNITRLDQEQFLDLCNEIGTFNASAGINMVTDSY